jgi:hypothetical protein
VPENGRHREEKVPRQHVGVLAGIEDAVAGCLGLSQGKGMIYVTNVTRRLLAVGLTLCSGRGQMFK